jgi:hypothetical protein
MNQEYKDIDKMSKRASRLRIIGLSFILLSFVAFIFFSTRQHKELVTKDIVIAKKDSALTQIQDSSLQILSQRDSLISIVTELFRLRNEHKADTIEKLYSDTLLTYFKYFKNVSKKEVTKSDKHYWATFSKDKFIFTEPVQIILDSSQTKAVVIGKQYQDGTNFLNERVEIQFDKHRKINSVRAFKMTEQ